MNMLDFIDEMFDKHNIYLDFDIDFTNNKIVVTIAKNDTMGYVIKDNIKLSTPEFDNNELPKENKAILFNKTTGVTVGTYYLLQDNTITTNQANLGRLWPPQTKYIAYDEVDAIKNNYTMEDIVRSELCGNIYNHCIQYRLAKEQTMVRPTNFRIGDKVTIIYQDVHTTVFSRD
jgi:hypothetical protein